MIICAVVMTGGGGSRLWPLTQAGHPQQFLKLGGDETFLLYLNETTHIPISVVHILENPGDFDLQLIRVQTGSYLGEDDIIRLEDRYARIS